MLPDTCTLDHLEPRWHPDRGSMPNTRRIVAACLKCNNDRDRDLIMQIPINILHQASNGARVRDLVRENANDLRKIQPVLSEPQWEQ